MNDPVKHCPVYKEIGCSHVDGYLCDFPDCSILTDKKEQEPVGTVKDLFTQAAWEKLDVRGSTKVYLGTPPAAQREWVELTDEDIFQLRREGAHEVSDKDFEAIEAKLKEKNT